MRFLYFLADTFIDTFGITRPSAKARKQAAFFILALVFLSIALATVAGFLVHAAIG